MNSYLPPMTEAAGRWVRFGLMLAALLLVCWGAYALREVLTPLLVAAAIAYVLNPLVTWMEQRGARRLLTVVALYVVGSVLLLVAGVYVITTAADQAHALRKNFPRYALLMENTVRDLDRWQRSTIRRAAAGSQPAEDVAGPSPDAPAESRPVPYVDEDDSLGPWRVWFVALVQEYGVLAAQRVLTWVQTFFSNFVNIMSVLVLIPLYGFFILWKFNDFVRVVHDHLPWHSRDSIVRVVQTVDQAIADFFRGRLLVCICIATLTAIGWSIVGVPYALLLGALGGFLNLIPFASILVLPLALIFTYLDAGASGVPWATPLMLTVGVFLAVQAVESFVLSPLIEGPYNGLHPLTTVIALLIGGKLAGLLGLLLAIPVTSTLKTLGSLWLLPEIRRLAAPPSAALPVLAGTDGAPASAAGSIRPTAAPAGDKTKKGRKR